MLLEKVVDLANIDGSPSGASVRRRGLAAELPLDFRGDFLKLVSFRRDPETRRLMERQASLKYKIVERTALIRLRLLCRDLVERPPVAGPSFGTVQSRQEGAVQHPHQ